MKNALLEKYDIDNLTIATLGSHSALQIMHGAKREGFSTLLISTKDRKDFYSMFTNIIDEIIVIDRWIDICRGEIVKELRERNVILIPHGSFVEYLGVECAMKIQVPLFGSRKLMAIEARQREKMRLLKLARIPIPHQYNIKEVKGIVIVKFDGAKGGKGYFLAQSRKEIEEKLRDLREKGIEIDSKNMIIQEFIIGVPMYFHFFYSPILERLELLGADIRYETLVARKTPDQEERYRLYGEVQKIVTDEAAALFLVNPVHRIAYRDWVKNYEYIGLLGFDLRFYNLRIEDKP